MKKNMRILNNEGVGCWVECKDCGQHYSPMLGEQGRVKSWTCPGCGA